MDVWFRNVAVPYSGTRLSSIAQQFHPDQIELVGFRPVEQMLRVHCWWIWYRKEALSGTATTWNCEAGGQTVSVRVCTADVGDTVSPSGYTVAVLKSNSSISSVPRIPLIFGIVKCKSSHLTYVRAVFRLSNHYDDDDDEDVEERKECDW
uniref:Uncharacterized protein n=1 Tax=Caenorhabditis japonica TaxID=281687 RepID=A0A8R1EDC5_CAEJA